MACCGDTHAREKWTCHLCCYCLLCPEGVLGFVFCCAIPSTEPCVAFCPVTSGVTLDLCLLAVIAAILIQKAEISQVLGYFDCVLVGVLQELAGLFEGPGHRCFSFFTCLKWVSLYSPS
jgi:hypothetical protein